MPNIDGEFLDDLASRFIINVPVEERSNLIRICFQVELAHWFYLDFFCANGEDLVPCGIKQFAGHIFKHVPYLRPHVTRLDSIMEDWKKYKLSVPTYGAILVSADLNHVLLVQSFWAKSSWGFPKGKVNENEEPVHCAVREVFEETGFDISHLISPTDYFESVFNYQFTRLYVVAGVPMDTEFLPRTRNEIKSCEWFPIDLLPNNKTDVDCKVNLGMNANSFFMVMPFIKKLKKWVVNRREQRKTHKMTKSESKVQNSKRQRHKSMGDIENLWQGVAGNQWTPQENNTFYNNQSGANSRTNKAMTVAKCGDTPANISTPIESSNKRREKINKPNIKRQLFAPDVTPIPDETLGSGSTGVLGFALANFPLKPQKPGTTGAGGGGAKAKNAVQLEARPVLKKMDVVRFKDWDNFTFDHKKISDCFALQ